VPVSVWSEGRGVGGGSMTSVTATTRSPSPILSPRRRRSASTSSPDCAPRHSTRPGPRPWGRLEGGPLGAGGPEGMSWRPASRSRRTTARVPPFVRHAATAH